MQVQYTIEVCVDCLFAHHYGVVEVDGEFFAGESDTPAAFKPLGSVEGLDLADATDPETGDGITEFSMNWCDGCDSHLGGSRYALAVFG